MPVISDEVVFDVGADALEFHTKTNGDLVLIRGLHLTTEQAASLAWLVNQGNEAILEIEIKVKS